MDERKKARIWQERCTNAELALGEALKFLADLENAPDACTEQRRRDILKAAADLKSRSVVADPTTALAQLASQRAMGPGTKVINRSDAPVGDLQIAGGNGARAVVKQFATARPSTGPVVQVGGGPGSTSVVKAAKPAVAPPAPPDTPEPTQPAPGASAFAPDAAKGRILALAAAHGEDLNELAAGMAQLGPGDLERMLAHAEEAWGSDSA